MPADSRLLIVGLCIGGAWLLWGASWLIAAQWASKAAKRPALREETAYRVLTIAGAALMFVQFRDRDNWNLLWVAPRSLQWVLFGVVVLGLAFTWWARIHLGTLWSARVTRKDGHRIVDSGPYAIVRHPIYAGLIIALIATVLPFAGPINIAGAAILIVSFVLKARLEERFLKQELGAETYESYQRRVPMLVPFWPMSAR
jgi:protein-S-isoprenylcysteine O-methyltransferase Ste14